MLFSCKNVSFKIYIDEKYTSIPCVKKATDIVTARYRFCSVVRIFLALFFFKILTIFQFQKKKKRYNFGVFCSKIANSTSNIVRNFFSIYFFDQLAKALLNKNLSSLECTIRKYSNYKIFSVKINYIEILLFPTLVNNCAPQLSHSQLNQTYSH